MKRAKLKTNGGGGNILNTLEEREGGREMLMMMKMRTTMHRHPHTACFFSTNHFM